MASSIPDGRPRADGQPRSDDALLAAAIASADAALAHKLDAIAWQAASGVITEAEAAAAARQVTDERDVRVRVLRDEHAAHRGAR